MNSRNIVLIEGHPDSHDRHLNGVLADAYAHGAQAAGHTLRRIRVAQLDFPFLRSQNEWQHGQLPETLKQAQDDIAWAQHLVLFFPLWLGDMPAVLKGFLEQITRPGFAFTAQASDLMGKKDSLDAPQGLCARWVCLHWCIDGISEPTA